MALFMRVIALSWVFTLVWFTLWMLMPYLTNVWKIDFTDAAAIINIFMGISAVAHIGLQFVVDELLGHFWVLLLSTLAFSIGLGFLPMSTPSALSNVTGMCSKYEPECIGPEHKLLFYAALTLISAGLYGHSISLGVFIEDQIDENVTENRPATGSFWIGNTGNFVFPLVAALAIPYIGSWSVRFAIPAICEVLAMIVFLTGVCTYKKEKPQGSPLTTVIRVLVASASKFFHEFPNDSSNLYERNESRTALRPRSNSLRFLDKAAIIPPNQPLEEGNKNIWTLCSITEVEETKNSIYVLPLFAISIISGIIFSLGNTFFLEQANRMDPKLGNLEIPLPILLLFYEASRLGTRQLCLRAAKKQSCDSEPPPRPTNHPFGIPISIILSVFCCMIAAHVEAKRLRAVKDQGLADSDPYARSSMSMFWLLPQYILLGLLVGVFENSFALYLEDKVQGRMSRYMVLLNVGVCGMGTMASVLLVYVVGEASGRGERPGWFQRTINESRMDKYYWVLAGLSAVNLMLYFLVNFKSRSYGARVANRATEET